MNNTNKTNRLSPFGAFGGLFFKEWVKTRWVLLILLVVLAGMMAYTFIGIATELRLMGANAVWENVVQKGITYFDSFRFLLLLSGVLLAVAQYVPEMTNKRFKLTLHLPLPEHRIMLTLLLFGVGCLAGIFGMAYGAVYIGTSYFYPPEITAWNLAAMQPWWWGGIAAYLLTTWICIEPVWRQRIFDGLLALGILALFYFAAAPGAYSRLLPYLIGGVVLSVFFSFYSLIRFKDGEQ
jgi:hypothetical protein